MSAFKTALRYIATQIRKELTIQSVAPIQSERKSASDKIQENKTLKTGLNGFAMLCLICLGVAVLVF